MNRPPCRLCWAYFLFEHKTDHAHEEGSQEAFEENMCLGSEERPVYPDVRGGALLCRRCDSWVFTPFPNTPLVPVHERPYTEAQEAEFARRAASVIRAEYRADRKARGILHGVIRPNPDRWHVPALGMVRERKYIGRNSR